MSNSTLPRAFIWRRLHSLTGLWLVLYLIIHLFTNSQAALFFGDNGKGFIKAANDIRELPFLPILEIVLLAIPFGIHAWWGVQYLFTGEFNSYKKSDAYAYQPYPRNRAYTWQRITSWILLVLITLHVIQMRFMEFPASADRGLEKTYLVRVNDDPGLESVAEKIGAQLYTPDQVENLKQETTQKQRTLETGNDLTPIQQEHLAEQKSFLEALNMRSIHAGQHLAVANNFGTVELLMVRETFKNPFMLILYTVLVISACFHAFNGLWTFMITWGVTLSQKSQRGMRIIANSLLFLIAFLGLAAVWGTYWINLRQ